MYFSGKTSQNRSPCTAATEPRLTKRERELNGVAAPASMLPRSLAVARDAGEPESKDPTPATILKAEGNNSVPAPAKFAQEKPEASIAPEQRDGS